MAGATPVQPRRLAFADALRGVAILLVVFVHVGLYSTPGSVFHLCSRFGQLGVQLFFVVSAFTLSYADERADNSWRSRFAFMARRWFRIAPLYYLAILGYFVFAAAWTRFTPWPVPFVTLANYQAPNVLLNLCFLHGFSPAANNTIVPGGWSIATEFGFYLIFALAFLGSSSRRLAAILGVYLVLGVTAATLFREELSPLAKNNEFLFFSLPVQLPCFLLGMLAYRWFRRSASAGPAIWAVAILPWPVILYLWTAPLWWAYLAIPTLASLSFSGLVILFASREFAPRWLVTVGERSFSIYLFHFALIAVLINPLTRALDFLGASASGFLAYVIIVLVATLGSNFTFRWIEKPGMAAGRRVSKAILSA